MDCPIATGILNFTKIIILKINFSFDGSNIVSAGGRTWEIFHLLKLIFVVILWSLSTIPLLFLVRFLSFIDFF